jgi:hypothetical protein
LISVWRWAVTPHCLPDLIKFIYIQFVFWFHFQYGDEQLHHTVHLIWYMYNSFIQFVFWFHFQYGDEQFHHTVHLVCSPSVENIAQQGSTSSVTEKVGGFYENLYCIQGWGQLFPDTRQTG